MLIDWQNTNDPYSLHLGDCLELMATIPDELFHSIVTDPPYGLSFMGKHWDHGIPGEAFWRQALRIAKPGAHLLAFGGTRTYHRLACAIEDAGWEMRDCLVWCYGVGFPKSHNLAVSIDKKLGHDTKSNDRWRAEAHFATGEFYTKKTESDKIGQRASGKRHVYVPISNEGIAVNDWGTALKPAWEPIIMARKPLEGSLADNALLHKTGAINIGACRVAVDEKATNAGRWPANFLHDASKDVIEVLGEANRFFYSGKASMRDRDEGLECFVPKRESDRKKTDGVGGNNPRNRTNNLRLNHHPTVKPTEVMRWLCRLVTPANGLILDPFMGSGSTGKAAMLENFRFVGIDKEPDYVELAKARIAFAISQKPAMKLGLDQLGLFDNDNH